MLVAHNRLCQDDVADILRAAWRSLALFDFYSLPRRTCSSRRSPSVDSRRAEDCRSLLETDDEGGPRVIAEALRTSNARWLATPAS